MSHSEPEATRIPEDRSLLLELLTEYKKCCIEVRAWQIVTQGISITNPQLVRQLLAAHKAALGTAEFHETARFRRTEESLREGSPYASLLRSLLRRSPSP